MPGYKPLRFTHTGPVEEKGLCGCKHNKIDSGPFCDGSHKTLLDW